MKYTNLVTVAILNSPSCDVADNLIHVTAIWNYREAKVTECNCHSVFTHSAFEKIEGWVLVCAVSKLSHSNLVISNGRGMIRVSGPFQG